MGNSIRTSQSDDDGCILDQEESLKQEWFVKNTQYLKKVAEKGIGEFTSQINNLIETYKIDSISCEETIPEICTFKQKFFRTNYYLDENDCLSGVNYTGNDLPSFPTLKTIRSWFEELHNAI